METKVCTKCKKHVPLNDFNKRAGAKDGLQYWCKHCRNANALENPPELSWRERNRNKDKESNKKYYQANKDKINKKTKEWRELNKEKVIAQNYNYRKQNPDVIKQIQLQRRAKKLKNGLFEISSKEIKKLYNSNCFYCGSKEKIQLDHVVPIAKGGSHSIGNLLPACSTCNASKGSKFLIEWKQK